MGKQTPWLQGRGFGRLLAQETNISDLLQFLSDRDSTPWRDLVGFVPASVERESRAANHADLLLVAEDGHRAAVEVKLGHVMDEKQQQGYEAIGAGTDLYLVALTMDSQRLKVGSTDRPSRWKFRSLTQVFGAWTDVDDEVARVLARQATLVLSEWDAKLSAVFVPMDQDGSSPLDVLRHKFLARVVTRRIAIDLRDRGRSHYAGVTKGGGLPLVQAWTRIRNGSDDRRFMAEIRWWETKPGGELRFGVDFRPRPGETENEELRRASFDLADSMDQYIDFGALQGRLEITHPRLSRLLHREKNSRPAAKGDWDEIIRMGFAGTPKVKDKKNTRKVTRPAFHGDGTLRFQAIADVDFTAASGHDIADLLDATLTYLTDTEPA